MLPSNRVKLFATTGTDVLARDVCDELQYRLPKSLQPESGSILGKHKVRVFDNENTEVQVENVRGYFVVVLHTQVPPVNDHLIELFALLDAIENAETAALMVFFPYMPFCRSDRKNRPRISTMGYRLPHILSTAYNIDKVILLDPHDPHIKHYFGPPAANEISASYLLIDHLQKTLLNTRPKSDFVVVYADSGAAKRYDYFAHLLKLPKAHIDKRERDENTNETEALEVVGNVRGKICLMVDDEILTGGTAIKNTDALLKKGRAKEVYLISVHGILKKKRVSDQRLIAMLMDSPIKKFYISDTIPIAGKISPQNEKFVVLTSAPLIAETVKRAVLNESLTGLHDLANVHFYLPHKNE